MSTYVFKPPTDSQGEPIYRGFPAPLLCGYKYELTIRVKKKVESCQGANYQDIYERAKKAVTDRINALNCFRTCGPKRSWQVARQWACEFIGNDLCVFATVKYVVLCPDTGQQGERGLIEPTADAFATPQSTPAGYGTAEFEKADEFVDIEYDDLEPLQCGANIFKIRYEQPSPNCTSYNARLRDFERNALTAGYNFSQLVHCSDCPLKLVVGLRILSSGCANDMATFSVEVIVLCFGT